MKENIISVVMAVVILFGVTALFLLWAKMIIVLLGLSL
jgi:hypothetical protein